MSDFSNPLVHTYEVAKLSNLKNKGWEVTELCLKRIFCFQFYSALADLRGGARDACPPPPGGPNSFIFMQFLPKKLQNNSTFGSWRPLLGEILDPPLFWTWKFTQNILKFPKIVTCLCGRVVSKMQSSTCNKIGQMLDFARSAYSCSLELVRHLAFRIKRNFAFRLFIDN